MAKTSIRLTSNNMVNTPGLLAWAINGYRYPSDRPQMIRCLMDGYNLSRECATDLLTGAVPYKTVEKDIAVFEYEEGKWKRADTCRSFRLECDTVNFDVYVSSDPLLSTIQCEFSDGQDDDSQYQAAIETMETLVLAAAQAGVDVESEAFRKAVDETMKFINSNYEE